MAYLTAALYGIAGKQHAPVISLLQRASVVAQYGASLPKVTLATLTMRHPFYHIIFKQLKVMCIRYGKMTIWALGKWA